MECEKPHKRRPEGSQLLALQHPQYCGWTSPTFQLTLSLCPGILASSPEAELSRCLLYGFDQVMTQEEQREDQSSLGESLVLGKSFSFSEPEFSHLCHNIHYTM